jgi:hypothetical protein
MTTVPGIEGIEGIEGNSICGIGGGILILSGGKMEDAGTGEGSLR